MWNLVPSYWALTMSPIWICPAEIAAPPRASFAAKVDAPTIVKVAAAVLAKFALKVNSSPSTYAE
jgi:hypothetical protein